MVVGSAFLCVMSGCKEAQTEQAVAEYAMLKVAPADKVLSTPYSATIRGRQDIAIYPQVAGYLTKLCVSEGQRVKAGQLLFVIDQVPYRAALAQAKALELSARNNYSYTEVKSPANGVVGTLPYRVGALVSPSGMPQPLTTVSDNSDMYVYFSLTENQLLGLMRQYGSKEEVLTQLPEVDLLLNDGSIYAHKGRVESISGVVDRSTGTASLRAVFPNPDGLLQSGEVIVAEGVGLLREGTPIKAKE